MSDAERPGSTRLFVAGQKWNGCDAGFACALLGLAPLIYVHALNLSKKPHFQFFPIAWLLFIALVYLRGEVGPLRSRTRMAIGIFLAAFSLGLGIVSVIWFSPWLAQVALIFACASWVLVRLTGNDWYQPVSWLSLLAITLPLPMRLDERLIQSLQTLSSRSASALLDMLAVPHLPTGNVIEIRTGKLFVDEACSGVDSLYALAAVGLGLVIWNRRNFLPSLLTLVTVPLWAWLGNTARILLIAVLLDRFGFDLTHGWPHTLLGLLTFAFSCSCLLLTQSSLTTAFEPFPERSINSGPFHALFNMAVAFPQRDPAADLARAVGTPSLPAVEGSQETGRAVSRFYCVSWLLIGGLSLFPVVGIGPWKRNSQYAPVLEESLVVQSFKADSLPAAIGDMRQVAFQLIHRDRDSINGTHSATWRYLDGQQQVQVSVDFPFIGFHALEVCYLLTGCSLTEPVASVEVQGTTGSATPRILNEIRFVNASADPCYVCYTAMDREGQSVSGVESRLSRGMVNEGAPPVSFQVQVFVEGCDGLTNEQRDHYRRVVLDVCDAMLPVIQTLPVN